MKTLFFTTFTLLCILFYAKTGSSQWTETGMLNGLIYPVISVADSNVVWAAGGEFTPVIYRSVNGGLNWSSIPVNGLPFGISGISAKDSLTAFVCDYAGNTSQGGNAKVFKTTNGGVNWLFVDSTGGRGYFNGLIFSKSNPQTGIAQSDSPLGLGTPFFILKTTDGGNNWFRQNPPGIPNSYGLYYSVFVIDNSFYGFIICNVSTDICKSYITSDGGANWVLGNDGFYTSNTADLVFKDNKNTGIFIVTTSLPNVQRTTNGGQSWNAVNTNSSLSGNVGAAWISGTNTVLVCGDQNTSGNTILRSDDGGLTWLAQNTSGVTDLVEIDYVRYNDKLVAYCINSTGKVIKTRQQVQPVGITQISNEIPEGFLLKQNYPNPFNPVTNLEFSISTGPKYSGKSGLVVLKIYDVLGNEVSTLVNEPKNPGSYKVAFDASGLPSGVYFYRLEAFGLSDTKSMMLLK